MSWILSRKNFGSSRVDDNNDDDDDDDNASGELRSKVIEAFLSTRFQLSVAKRIQPFIMEFLEGGDLEKRGENVKLLNSTGANPIKHLLIEIFHNFKTNLLEAFYSLF